MPTGPAPTQTPQAAPAASPTPTVEQIINPAPTPPRAPQVPAPPAPRAANAPVPVVTPAPQEPAPAGPKLATDDMLVKVNLDGREVEMPVSTVKKEVKLGMLYEQRLAQLGRQQAELTRAAEVGNLVLAHKNDPEQLTKRLAEHLGIQLQAEHTNDADDGLEPAQKALDARLKRLEAQLTQQYAEKQASTLQAAIEEELQKYPLFKNDRGELQAAMTVVAANIREGMSPEKAPAFIAGWHQDRADAIKRLTTLERDQRVEAAAIHATVPPSAGTPALTANDPPRLETKDLQRNAADAFRRGASAIWDRIKP